MPLSLTRPLIFFDLETTGTNVYNDKIIQIGAIKLMPDGLQTEYNQLFNPGIKIPKESIEIHHITDDMVKDAPRFGDRAIELSELFFEMDLGGYNIKNFDVPFLMTEFQRIGMTLNIENIKLVDAYTFWRIMEPRTLTAAYQKFCGKELINAHDAMADIRASLDILNGQLNYYKDSPQTVEALHELCFPHDPDAYDIEKKLRWVDGKLTITFGKNKGKTLQELATNDPGYLEWILNGNFSDKVKDAIKKILQK